MSSPDDKHSRRERIQRVRDFVSVFQKVTDQKMVCTTGAATALWIEDLKEVIKVIDLGQEMLNWAKERCELSEAEAALAIGAVREGETPRTDAERIRILTARISYEDKFDEAIDHARQIERQLTTANNACLALEEAAAASSTRRISPLRTCEHGVVYGTPCRQCTARADESDWHQLYQHEVDRREKAEEEVELYRTQLQDATVRLAEAQESARSATRGINLHDLHSALEPFAMMALHSRDEWRKQDGSMRELGVPRDCDALIDGYKLTQGQLDDVEDFYGAVEKLLKSSATPDGRANAKESGNG